MPVDVVALDDEDLESSPPPPAAPPDPAASTVESFDDFSDLTLERTGPALLASFAAAGKPALDDEGEPCEAGDAELCAWLKGACCC